MRLVSVFLVGVALSAGEHIIPRIEIVDSKNVKTELTDVQFFRQTRSLLGTDTEAIEKLEIKHGEVTLEIEILSIKELEVKEGKIKLKADSSSVEGEIEKAQTILIKGKFSEKVEGKITLDKVKSLRVQEKKK